MPRKNRDDRDKFRRDFPFVDEIRRQVSFLPPGPAGAVDHFEIHVNLADADVLYDQQFNALDAADWLSATQGAAKQSQLLFVVTTELAGNEIKQCVKLHDDFHYVRDVFGRPGCGFLEVDYLVWVTIVSIYKGPSIRRESSGDPADFLRREVFVMIYKPPKEGFAELYRLSRPSDTFLHTFWFLRQLEQNNPDFVAISSRLRDLTGEFIQAVYDPGLRARITTSRKTGMSGNYGGVLVTSVRRSEQVATIKLTDSKTWFSFQCLLQHEDATPGIVEVFGPLAQIEELFRKVLKSWQRSKNPAARFKDNPNVFVR